MSSILGNSEPYSCNINVLCKHFVPSFRIYATLGKSQYQK